LKNSEKLKEIIDRKERKALKIVVVWMTIRFEDLSDIFMTVSDTETDEIEKRPPYLEEFDKFSVEANGEPEAVR
jgi:poly(A)-specific ribonuclease